MNDGYAKYGQLLALFSLSLQSELSECNKNLDRKNQLKQWINRYRMLSRDAWNI
jgi:hypothetical protein